MKSDPLVAFQALGYKVYLSDEKIRFAFNGSELPDEETVRTILAQMRECKPEILKALRSDLKHFAGDWMLGRDKSKEQRKQELNENLKKMLCPPAGWITTNPEMEGYIARRTGSISPVGCGCSEQKAIQDLKNKELRKRS